MPMTCWQRPKQGVDDNWSQVRVTGWVSTVVNAIQGTTKKKTLHKAKRRAGSTGHYQYVFLIQAQDEGKKNAFQMSTYSTSLKPANFQSQKLEHSTPGQAHSCPNLKGLSYA